MKEGWEYCQLEDAVKKGSSNISLNKIKGEDGEYPVFAAKGFVQNVSFYHQEEDYLGIIKDGAGIGRVSKHPAKSSVVGTMQYLIPKEGFDIDFIKYFLEGIDFEKHRNGSTIPHIYFKDYKSEKFPKIPLPEQQRIVTILDQAFAAIDKAKANAEKNLQNAKELFESYLQGVFENGQEQWEEKTLVEVCEFRNGAAHEKHVNEEGKYILVNSKFISSDGQKFKRTNDALSPLFVDDIAFVMSDVPNGKALAKCFLVEQNDKYTLNQRIGAIKSNDFIPEFLVYQFNRNNYLLSFNNGENQTNLRKGDILKCPLFLPSKEKQQIIVDELDVLRAETQKLEAVYQKKMNDLEELKKSILQKAFAGELETEKELAL